MGNYVLYQITEYKFSTRIKKDKLGEFEDLSEAVSEMNNSLFLEEDTFVAEPDQYDDIYTLKFFIENENGDKVLSIKLNMKCFLKKDSEEDFEGE